MRTAAKETLQRLWWVYKRSFTGSFRGFLKGFSKGSLKGSFKAFLRLKGSFKTLKSPEKALVLEQDGCLLSGRGCKDG